MKIEYVYQSSEQLRNASVIRREINRRGVVR